MLTTFTRRLSAIIVPFLFVSMSAFFASVSSVSAQHPDLDKLRELANANKDNDSLNCALFGELGYYYAFRNYDSSLYYLNKAVAFSDSIQNMELNVRYHTFLGMSYAINGHLDSSIKEMKVSEKLAKTHGLDSTLAQVQYGLGNAYHMIGEMNNSLDYFLKALSYFETKKQWLSVNSVKANIADIYLSLEEYEKARPIIMESNKYYVENGIQTGIRNGYGRLSKIFIYEGELDSAYKYLVLAKELTDERKEHDAWGEIEINLSKVLFLKNDFKAAIKHLEQSVMHYDTKGGNSEELVIAYSRLAYCYVIIGKSDEGLVEFEKATSLKADSEGLESQVVYYQCKYKIDSIRQDYKTSLEAYQIMSNISEQILDAEKSEQLTEMETKYDSEKKEAEIASLSQQATIQTLELEQKNLTILVGGVLVLLIAGFVFFANRQKTLKSQQSQAELEQRFLRSQLNPHFISNALLAVQNFMLKNQSDLAVTYLSKFSKLMRETLENSRREFILLEDELAMLTNFMDVHKMRLSDSFDYEVHVSDLIDPEVDTIPPMFVQPFVENAIAHGITPAGGKGKIELYFEKEGEYISIVIKDNGGGYTQATSQTQDHLSLSTTIIQERMAVFNKTLKKKISLVLANIKNEQGEILGAKVELKVPFKYI